MIAAGVGQAGNQILGLTARYMGPLVPPSRKQPGYAFVDSEPKVVRPLRTPGDPMHLPFATPESIAYDQNGRGNNWAHGYSGIASHRGVAGDGPHMSSQRAAPLSTRALAAIRKQAEASDRFDSLMVVHSLGGGTGSGLGSRMLELARDAYPEATLLSVCVAPFETGDTPLQWYNTVLTLATAHEVADAILFFDNGDLMHRAGKLRSRADALFSSDASEGASGGYGAAKYIGCRPASAGGRDGGAKLNTTDLNNVVAQCLAGVSLATKHRGPIPRMTRQQQRVAADAAAAAPADGRPAWIDVGPDGASGPPEEAFHNPYAQPDPDDGWFASGAGASPDDDGGLRSGGGPIPAYIGQPFTTVSFDALGFVTDMVPSPAYRYIDVRYAAPLQPHNLPLGPHGGPPASSYIPSFADPASVSWVDLSELLVETLPRHMSDRGGVSPGSVGARAPAPVVTLTSTLIARGASQADCDSVDPALTKRRGKAGGASGSAGGGNSSDQRSSSSQSGRRQPLRPAIGGAAASQQLQWRGLPTSPDWAQVSLRLSRAQAFSSALSPDRQRLARLSPGPVYDSPLTPLRQPRSLTLASNSSNHVPILARAVQRVALQASVGAYIHHYERFGITRDHIAVAAESVTEVVEAYQALAPGYG